MSLQARNCESMDRLRSEQQFHDEQAAERAEFFAENPNRLLVSDEEYLDHETWIRPAMAQLGDVRGKRILDYGCGHGMASIVLARRGATVIAFDLSLGYLQEVQRRADVNQVSISTIQADGEGLPFADNTFDGIWGNAVLHHLNIEKAGLEIARVLKPNGIAVFCEPWGGNPIVNWARARLAYREKDRTPDEMPLRQSDVTKLRTLFPRVDSRGYQLFSMVGRVIRTKHLHQFLDGCDRVALRLLPILQQFCRYVVITLKR